MKYIILIILSLSSFSTLAGNIFKVSKLERTGGCNLSVEAKDNLIFRAKLKAQNFANLTCERLHFYNVSSSSVRSTWSPYANPGEVCTGTVAYVQLEFSCYLPSFYSLGKYIDTGFRDPQKEAQFNAINNAKQLCNGEVKRVSDWSNYNMSVKYWVEYHSKAKFECI